MKSWPPPMDSCAYVDFCRTVSRRRRRLKHAVALVRHVSYDTMICIRIDNKQYQWLQPGPNDPGVGVSVELPS